MAGALADNADCYDSEIDAATTDRVIEKQVSIGVRSDQSVRCHASLAPQALHVFSSTGKLEHQSPAMNRACNDNEYTSFFQQLFGTLSSGSRTVEYVGVDVEVPFNQSKSACSN